MNAEDYRRKARDLFAVAQLLSRPEDRTIMIAAAALWTERAEEAEQAKRIQQTQKEPEGEQL
jgi:hypothetical protein